MRPRIAGAAALLACAGAVVACGPLDHAPVGGISSALTTAPPGRPLVPPPVGLLRTPPPSSPPAPAPTASPPPTPGAGPRTLPPGVSLADCQWAETTLREDARLDAAAATGPSDPYTASARLWAALAAESRVLCGEEPLATDRLPMDQSCAAASAVFRRAQSGHDVDEASWPVGSSQWEWDVRWAANYQRLDLLWGQLWRGTCQ